MNMTNTNIEEGDGHDHAHGGFLGENTELYFAIGSGVFWLTGLILSFQAGIPEMLTTGLFVVALILGGYFTLMEAIETIRKGKFEIDFLMLVARGIKAMVEGKTVHIGNRRLFQELTGEAVPEEIDQKMAGLEKEGHTAMIVHQDSQYLGIISVMDVARPEAASTLQKLKQIGIQRMVMLTGDNQQVADAVAKNIGITDPMGNLLPEDKVRAIEKLKQEEGKVAMIGDGVNDAPAMAKSTT